jgi:hypothetical protein
MEDVNIYNCHIVYFSAKWYILCPFGTFCGHLVFFPHIEILHREKSGNPVEDGFCIEMVLSELSVKPIKLRRPTQPDDQTPNGPIYRMSITTLGE